MNLNFWPKMYYSGGGGGGGGSGGGGGGGGYGSGGGAAGGGAGYGGGAGAGGAGGFGGGAAGEQPPEEPTPVGAFRFNTDTAKLEYYDGNQWVNVSTTSPEAQTGGTRGFLLGGTVPGSFTDRIEHFNIDTTGNNIDFGNLLAATSLKANTSDRTRLCCFGDYDSPNTSMSAAIDYITMSSTGDSQDFGDMSQGAYSSQPVSSSTRGVYMGGTNVYNSVSGTFNNIEYITIQSTGDSKDFGDLSQKSSTGQTGQSPTRGIVAGGWTPSPGTRLSNIQYIMMSTLGNSTDFGDIITASAFTCGNGASNAIRGLITNNNTSPGTYVNVIQYITTATLGNAQDFGDLVRGSEWTCGAASPTRAVFHNPGGNTDAVHMDHAQIMTKGNAIDFGDATQALGRSSAGSNGHGGLG